MNTNTSAHKRNIINGLLSIKTSLQLSNNLIRIIFSCDKPLKVDPLWIGPHLKLLFPMPNCTEIVFPQTNEENKIIWPEGLRERVRTYSIRDYNEQDNTITIDFVVHAKGIATLWAQQAKAGDTIGLVAMGSKNRYDESMQLVLLGDIAAMPAICYTLEHLPEQYKSVAIIEVRSEQDKVSLTLPKQAQIEWIVTPQGSKSQLIDRVAQLNLATVDSNLIFWGGMESSIAQSLRHYLKDHFSHLSPESTRLISYWREGFAEGEFKHHD